MKIFKRVGMGLAAIAIMLPMAVSVVTGSALAAAPGAGGGSGAASNYSFSDAATISGQYNGSNLTFTDSNVIDNLSPKGSTNNYVGDHRNFVPDKNAGYCDPGDMASKNGIAGNIRYGINIDPTADLTTATPLNAEVKMGTEVTQGKGTNQTKVCQGTLFKTTVDNPSGLAATAFQWNDQNIVNLNNQAQETFGNAAGDNANQIFLHASNDACKTDSAIVLDSSGASSGTYIELSLVGGYPRAQSSTDWTQYPNLAPYVNKSACNVTGHGGVLISGTQGAAAPGYGGSTGSADVNANCVNNSNSSGLEWLLCPITTSMEKSGDWFNSKVENQLNFDIKSNLPDNGPVHLTWSIIKNISSGLIVVLLLTMVIAQAMGGGPFEAYTIRKMLPKLVAAVIVMQLSWPICVWLIGLANDFGHGIGSLIAVPFGGVDAISLNSILHTLGWGGVSQGILPIAFLGLGIAAAVALPTTFVMLFGLLMGFVAAFLVLLFRNVLIIALTIFSPLAFLAWTMSGTESLWKTWKENFMKLLAMFPLVIGILYVGRAFAWIIAHQGGVHGGFDYLTILVAFFGPYFVIFKAYKWGGSMLSAAGSGIAQARQGAIKAASPALQKLGERAQGNLATRYKLAGAKQRQAFGQRDKTADRVSRLQKKIEEGEAAGQDMSHEKNRLAQMQRVYGARTDRALDAQRKNGRFRRAMYRIGSGAPLPTSRSQLETIAKGDAYHKELVDQKQALIMHDYVEQLNSGATVSQAKEYIRDKYGFGNIDANGNTKDSFTERAFYNWLVDTNSAMEMGDEKWRTGNGRGPDLMKRYGFINMMNSDSNRYRYVAGKLPEFQPFNQGIGGGPKEEDFLPNGKSYASLSTEAKEIIDGGGEKARQLAATLADDARYAKIFRQLEHTRDIAEWRPEQLEMMVKNIEKLKAEGVPSSQAEDEMKKIFSELAASSTPEARGTLQQLMGGERSARKSVNELMGDRWLEDTLQVPVSEGGVIRITALPKDLQQLARSIVTVSGPTNERNPATMETARTLAEGGNYTVAAHGRSEEQFESDFRQIRDNISASRSSAGINQINFIVDQAIQNVNERASRRILEASTQIPPLSAEQLEDLRQKVNAETKDKIAKLQGLKIAAPSEDPSEMKIEHNIITPDQPGYQPPSSSQLPGNNPPQP